MSNNKEILMKEITEHFNEVVITGAMEIARLVGFCETEDDYYYITAHKYGNQLKGASNNLRYITAVGRIIFLKDSMQKEDYDFLDNVLSLNGAEKVDTFIFKDERDKEFS